MEYCRALGEPGDLLYFILRQPSPSSRWKFTGPSPWLLTWLIQSWKNIAWDFNDVAVETEYNLKPLDTSTSLPELESQKSTTLLKKRDGEFLDRSHKNLYDTQVTYFI